LILILFEVRPTTAIAALVRHAASI